MSSRSIRSVAHRKILSWLRGGPSTVSELANQFGMRMPHASLACRQLRDAGLITRDETGGLRNAPMFLSQLGVQRLTEDSVAKMMQYAEELRAHRQPMVLHADENNVLVAYTESPESSLIFIPDPVLSDHEKSSGNTGGFGCLPRNGTFAGTTLMADIQVKLHPNETTPLQILNPKCNGLASFEVKCLNVMARDVLLKVNVSHWMQPLPLHTVFNLGTLRSGSYQGRTMGLLRSGVKGSPLFCTQSFIVASITGARRSRDG